ncbi:MAG: hypothetical protein ACRECH_01525 [Nitrososphaerales archaeon]
MPIVLPIAVQNANLDKVKEARLVEVFGKTGTELILKHLEDLEETFGSASAVIKMVMDGKMKIPKARNDST